MDKDLMIDCAAFNGQRQKIRWPKNKDWRLQMSDDEVKGKAKVRSPRAPAYDLEESLKIVRVIFDNEHHNKMGANTIAGHLKMQPGGGTFLTKMAALSYYGLLDRVGKADYRVSERAKTILLSNSENEKRQAMNEALRQPTLFAALCDEFAGSGMPTEANLTNQLVRDGFSATKGSKVAHAFLASAKYAGFGEDRPDAEQENVQMQSEVGFPPENKYCVQEIPLGGGRRAIIKVPDDINKDDIGRIARVLNALYT
jgi:hypothetical protein